MHLAPKIVFYEILLVEEEKLGYVIIGGRKLVIWLCYFLQLCVRVD